MGKQATIKEIAQMAGVSAGTVDRIIHNRGNVAEDKRKRIEEVIARVGYRTNVHASAISYKKVCRIVLAIPETNPGEYWDDIREGILEGLKEYSDIRTDCIWLFFDQFNRESCREQFEKIPSLEPDAVILGPAFVAETQELCKKLDAGATPYAFIDKTVPDTAPVASFTADQPAGGSLMGRIMLNVTPSGTCIAALKAIRTGEDGSKNSDMRQKGLLEFFSARGMADRLVFSDFSITDGTQSRNVLLGLLKDHPDISGIAVLNSRGHIIADILSAEGIAGIHVVSFDFTEQNARCLKNGSIEALLCQRPRAQGYKAVSSIIHFLLFKKVDDGGGNYMPIDILMAENLPFYRASVL